MFLYLCSVKRIEYIMPIDSMRGNITGRNAEKISYNGLSGYDVTSGVVEATNYTPKLIAQLRNRGTRAAVRIFQVRTRTSVNAQNRFGMAVCGGAMSILGAIIYGQLNANITLRNALKSACPANFTLRQWLYPYINGMLSGGESSITVSQIRIDNPWKVANPNVIIPTATKNKFNSILSQL